MSDDPPFITDAPDTAGDSSRVTDDTQRVETADDGVASSPPLAVVVPKERTGIVIESLTAEGVYDDARHVRAFDDETTAIPVTSPPTDTRVRDVIQQIDPPYRTRTLEEVLRARGFSESDLETIPQSWAVIGSVVVVRMPPECVDEREVAQALLELHGNAESVLADEGITNDGREGIYRKPQRRYLAGSRDTETVHTEHGSQYVLDPATVMFSPGNKRERVRMGEQTTPDEHVFDMFAGIGYFTIPIARAGGHVTATELNPRAFRYLVENAALNEVTDQIDAYMSDCRDLAPDLEADRVVMGYYGVDETPPDSDHGTRTNEAAAFLEDALTAVRPGGVIHYHAAVPESLLWDRPLERLETAFTAAGYDLEVLEKRRVKSHSAGVFHIVVDARVVA